VALGKPSIHWLRCGEIPFQDTYSKEVNSSDSSLAVVWAVFQLIDGGAQSRAALSLESGLSFPAWISSTSAISLIHIK
jgi:hypothetical protein